MGQGSGSPSTALRGNRSRSRWTRLAEFVTERGNPANEKRVAVVDVELPALAPYEGIRFVDTPGLGSVFAHNTRVSKEWMPRVGAALVAVSVNHPLSEDDLLLLNDVSLHTPEAVLLLTKADLVSGEELASVIEFTRSQATSRTGKEWTVLPVSNRPGFEGMREEVAEYLRERIAGRREEAFGEIARHKVRALVAGCREYLLLAERAAEAADTARSDLIEALARERRGFRLRKGGAPAPLQPPPGRGPDRGGRAVSRLPWRSDGAGDRESPGGDDGVEGEPRTGDPGVRGVARRRDDGGDGGGLPARRGAPRGFSLPGAGERRAVGAGLRGPAGGGDRARLGIRFEGARFDPQVEEPAHPDVRLSPTFDTHFELLWFLIPMPVFRPLVRTAFPAQDPVGGREEPLPRGGPVGRRRGRLDRRSVTGTRRRFSGVSSRRSRDWSAKPMRGTGSRRSGPRSRSFPPSNPRYPDTLMDDTRPQGGFRCAQTS